MGEKRIRGATNYNFYFRQCPYVPKDAHLAFVQSQDVLKHAQTFQMAPVNVKSDIKLEMVIVDPSSKIRVKVKRCGEGSLGIS